MMALPASKPRYAYMDALRIIAAFLVIVNHTVFYSLKRIPAFEPGWYVTVILYYICKIAVPLYVMVSGACLLGKVDSYKKIGLRVLRIVLALLMFSYMFFLHEAWVNYGLWPRAIAFGEFFSRVWTLTILDDYWYLNMYIGLMLMLPLMQRLASAMKNRDYLYLIGVSLVLDTLWPLIVHYVPGLELPPYFSIPMLGTFIGLYFAGYWVHRYLTIKRWHVIVSVLVMALSLVLSVGLSALEATPGQTVTVTYLFMDNRNIPSIFMALGAIGTMIVAKALFSMRQVKHIGFWRELGGCAFGIYMWQGFLIDETLNRLYWPLNESLSPVASLLVWELAVFALALALTWLMRRIPLIKKVL